MDTVTSLCKKSLKLIRECLNKIRKIDEINKHLIYINNTIRIVRKAVKINIHKQNKLENSHSLEASLSLLKCYRIKLKQLKKI